MADTTSRISLEDVRASVQRIRDQGEKLVDRIRTDAKDLIASAPKVVSIEEARALRRASTRIHVSPEMIAIAWRVLGPDRLFLVTDAIAALGLPHGPFRVGDTVVHVDEEGPRTVRGVLAGSVLRMDEAVRNLIAFTGCSTAEAVAAATTNPARLLGRSDVGVLQPGAYADVVLLDGDNRVAATVAGGRVVFDPQHRLSS